MEGWEGLVYASREGLESSSPEDDIPEDPIGDVVAIFPSRRMPEPSPKMPTPAAKETSGVRSLLQKSSRSREP